ncbi:MAG: transposase [Lentisphaerae bacterium]|nr:transposase [Lentisphaerota bacterium]MBT4816028.1 transposase [Lentisphaerota bacterium]MBT5608917.1 transposase [Lentisphaerota bacterium]MBT7053509.1 transposase [Lentisphaerota bacterium]MBT7842353.1 transposase [Lentisphaerota bacterium]
MASITHHRNKKTGAVYVYSVESYWDKEKKAPRNRQTCLGRLDPETGEVIPSKRKRKIAERAAVAPGVTVTSRVAGPSLVLDVLTRSCGIGKLLKTCFPDDYDLILSLVHYIVHKGGALSRAEPWSGSCLHPFGDVIASQRVSELLRRLSADDRQRFLSLWLDHVQEDDWLCYDITSVSSYSRHNEYTHFGYNRDGDSLEQVNLAMLFGQKSGLPAHYRRLPGNISDVSTLRTTVKSLDFLGAGKLHFVLDRGFYSVANIDELFRHRHKFTIALPAGRSGSRPSSTGTATASHRRRTTGWSGRTRHCTSPPSSTGGGRTTTAAGCTSSTTPSAVQMPSTASPASLSATGTNCCPGNRSRTMRSPTNATWSSGILPNVD